MKIYAVRHGETMFNVKGMIQGWCDSPLTKQGIQEAKWVGKGLADVPFKVCYTSPSLRAYDTAKEIIGQRDIPLQVSWALREMHFGDLEGDCVKDRMEEWHQMYYTGFHRYGGETKEEAGQRILQEWKRIASVYPQETVLVVSHGWSIRSGLREIDTTYIDDLYNRGIINVNCAVSIIEIDELGKATILDAFDPSFLQRGKEESIRETKE